MRHQSLLKTTALVLLAVVAASCSIAPRVVVRNESGRNIYLEYELVSHGIHSGDSTKIAVTSKSFRFSVKADRKSHSYAVDSHDLPAPWLQSGCRLVACWKFEIDPALRFWLVDPHFSRGGDQPPGFPLRPLDSDDAA